VEWESSALDFLLEHGFSPQMGARPLKRSIDQHLLAPLAATMVEHRFPQGDQFLFVRSDGHAIQVEFVDPDAKDPGPPQSESHGGLSSRTTLAHLIVQPGGTVQEHRLLQQQLLALEERLAAEDWNGLREGLQASMQSAEFWERAGRHGVLARYALLDRVTAATATARGLAARLDRSRTASGNYSRDLVQRLAAQLWIVRDGIEDALADAPIEVALRVDSSLEAGSDPDAVRAWREQILDMYRAWVKQRRMHLDEVAGAQVLLISGFGASRLLQGEAGLHVLEQGTVAVGRTVARVTVMPTPLGASAKNHAALLDDMQKLPASTTVIRRYRLHPSPLIRDARWGWRTGRADLVLGGQLDLLTELLQD
jgi:ATP-dependent Clp protease ATP-binding subunit ClpC